MKTLNFLAIFLLSGILAVSLSLSSCGGTEEKSEDDLKDMLLDMEDAVNEVHDEVMPIQNDLRRKANDLMAQLEEKGDDLDEATQEEMRNLIERLQSAHQSMFEWMGEWADADKESMEFEQAKEFFEQERMRISEIADNMRSSLADAEEFMKTRVENQEN